MLEEDKLDRCFRLQRKLQVAYGTNFGMTGEKLVTFVKDMIIACEDELHEALAEVHWKPWSVSQAGFRDRDAFAGELRDAFQFLMNLMLAAHVTPDELVKMLEDKLEVNHRRQDTGYTGTEKCDKCGRALDEPGIMKALTDAAGFRFCTEACRDSYED